jgi:hypothetical protein
MPLLLLLRFFVWRLVCERDLGEVGEASIREDDVGEVDGRRCEGAPVEEEEVQVVDVERAAAVVITVPGCLRFCPLLKRLAFSSFWGNESSTSAMVIEVTVVVVVVVVAAAVVVGIAGNVAATAGGYVGMLSLR